MKIANELAKRLLEINAIKLNPNIPFTWASGMRSPIYCDNRLSLSYPELRNFIKQSFAELLEEWSNIELIAGVATAGIPHAALVADYMEKPMIYVRSKPKEHGRQNLIEGHFTPGARTIVVEDLISTGKSSLQAVEALKEEGLNILAVVSIFDYQLESAKNNFASHHCSYRSLSNYNSLLGEAIKINYISQKENDILLDWNKNPQEWYKNNFR